MNLASHAAENAHLSEDYRDLSGIITVEDFRKLMDDSVENMQPQDNLEFLKEGLKLPQAAEVFKLIDSSSTFVVLNEILYLHVPPLKESPGDFLMQTLINTTAEILQIPSEGPQYDQLVKLIR